MSYVSKKTKEAVGRFGCVLINTPQMNYTVFNSPPTLTIPVKNHKLKILYSNNFDVHLNKNYY